jgi:hypothetical protein
LRENECNLRLFDGNRGRRIRAAIKHRNFGNRFAGNIHGQYLFASAGRGFENSHLSPRNNVESLAGLALVKQNFSRAENFPDGSRGQQLQLGLGKTGEQRRLLKYRCQIHTLDVQSHPSNHAWIAVQNRNDAIGGK